MTVLWVQLRSWHIDRGENKTLCGRRWVHIANAWSPTLPADEKSCESCLRIEARRG